MPELERKNYVKDPVRYKTVLCNKWEAQGRCPYGPRCQFAHGAHELRDRASSGGSPPVRPTAGILPPPDLLLATGSLSAPTSPMCLPCPNEKAVTAGADEHAAEARRAAEARVAAVALQRQMPPAPAPSIANQPMPSPVPARPTVAPAAEYLDQVHGLRPLVRKQESIPLIHRQPSPALRVDAFTGQVLCSKQASFQTLLVRRTISNVLDEMDENVEPHAPWPSAMGLAAFPFALHQPSVARAA